MSRSPYDFAFVVEQVLGHITHGDNLRRHVPQDPEVRAHWAFPAYPAEGTASRVPVFRSNWTVRSGVRARRLLREIRRSVDLDAIFFHTQVPAMVCPDLVRRFPSVVSLDATPLQYDELGSVYEHATGPAVVERLKFRAARATFDAATHLVTWSRWAKEGLAAQYGISPEKVAVIAPGVDVDDWVRPDARRIDLTRPTRVLFVGGDLERKGGRLLVEVCRELTDLDVELHVATRDPLDSAPRLVVHHGLTANSPELRRLYHECDVFALPTMGDCLPMVLSEAGAAGLATISTRVAAIPEIVCDGTTGLLTAPGDASGLAAALRRLIERPEERLAMGQRAVAHIRRHYDTAANTRRLLCIMKEAADGHAGAGSQ